MRSLHRCAHGWVEVLLADQIDDAGSLQVIIHVTVEAGEDERDDSSRRLDQLGQRTHARGIDMVEGLSVEHQPMHGARARPRQPRESAP